MSRTNNGVSLFIDNVAGVAEEEEEEEEEDEEGEDDSEAEDGFEDEEFRAYPYFLW